MATTTGDPALDALYRQRTGTVAFVDVPELAVLAVDGEGGPGSEPWTDALQALYSVSYAAHFAVKKAGGTAPRVMPLEAQWWVEGGDAQATMERIVAGEGTMADSDRGGWRWRALIVQLAPIDGDVVADATRAAREKNPLPGLDRLVLERFTEGPSAQILHVGPYATEQTSLVTLHRAIAEHGSTPRGRHHEIYLSDPRRTAPERVRTILRQPIEPLG